LELTNFNPGWETKRISSIIQDEVVHQGYDGGVIGLSGGIDSSVCAALMTRALGAGKVIGISMTERDSRPEDYDDAKLVAEHLNIEFVNHPITEHLESLDFYKTTQNIDFKQIHKDMLELDSVYSDTSTSSVLVYNTCLKLRTRAWILAHYAKLNNYFQCQTLNHSEILLGYLDLFGDAIGDIAPIQHLYKSEIYALGEYLALPGKILNRPSMSGNYNRDPDLLFSNDEFLRMPMREVDVILFFLSKLGDNIPLISHITGYTEEQVRHINGLVKYAKDRWAIPAGLSR